MDGAYWLVVDRLCGDGAHTCETLYHFAPGVRVTREGRGVEIHTAEDTEPRLWQSVVAVGAGGEDAELELSLEPVQAEMHCGAPVTVSRLRGAREGPLPLVVATLFSTDHRTIELSSGPGRVEALITGPEGRWDKATLSPVEPAGTNGLECLKLDRLVRLRGQSEPEITVYPEQSPRGPA